MQESKKKIILVTGGAGFIGSNLIEQLVKDPDNQVYSLDNYSTGSKENHIAGATYIEGDTRDIAKLLKIKPDLVFHLGEYARVEKSFEDMETVWRSNKDGTFAVLEFCRGNEAKLVYAGSSTKFGDGGLGRDQSPYAWTKASNTELVKNYGVWFGLKYAITYFYNVYGPREISAGGFATVIGIFKEKMKKGKPLTVVSPGTQTRIFTHVDDIVRGLMLVGEKGIGDGYGLGAEEEYSILDIAKMFGGEIEMLPERAGNRMTSSIDLSRSRGELDWKARKNIKEHIKEFVVSQK
ncbi:MAG: Polysaccharide biosynthesis protein [Candidatus Kaiserbacteria bacterium GW2011_GWA2_49_19]|uniref:Polysaccharide biosynthesis protein n=1 Tax=Candidatus Kaiserbacteria bacterium GW2011_GWA2_49_19 TaxID=1618669 RepID=A0A0G1Y3N4_9BACT|nr:MAG: Polysaccharide biosynthesis protein [Candidatus Kaiserbacteria bacterium GW2011_GWA2_49_19]